MRVSYSITLGVICLAIALAGQALGLGLKGSVYTNPVLAGWHSDPSCVYVAEKDTIFCVVSTFIAFPGLPIYATKDLQNWKHISNAFNRRSQIPSLAETTNQQGGIYAPTLRYHKGKFYLIVTFLGPEAKGLVFTTTDPYDNAAWSEPLEFAVRGIDPDIFWDDDGSVYVTSSDNQAIPHYSLDLETGATGPVTWLWNGTGGVYPEGPHLYRKDGYYYLMIAEGGTELNHAETMARSRNRTGPWEPCPHNPILTNRNTTQYFQTVGHADLFQDGAGHWWAVALSTRSGPAWKNYPMGRETVLAPAVWPEGQWPIIQHVRGRMWGPLPEPNKGSLVGVGIGAFAGAPDRVAFAPGSTMPAHFMYWRFPKEEYYTISPPGHPHTLRLTPSKSNLTGTADFQPDDGITFVSRRQTDTLFTYGVDVAFDPKVAGEEAGVTLFLTQYQHVDLGIVLLGRDNGELSLSFRFRVEGRGNFDGVLPSAIVPVPKEWQGEPVRLEIQAVSDTEYVFSAALAGKPGQKRTIGRANALLVSGDTGRFTGTLVGVYATSNGGAGSTEAYVSRWRYDGEGQKIDDGVVVPS
ncbi:glycosyl hydrolase [Aspergillus ambiguus]|uniref:glycoside hydrolase family 43 protein n=1 Tax=Aspergillus ambiguus TaxID=176160 RepID=UPI003CCDEF9C